jgi:hypothetical protein
LSRRDILTYANSQGALVPPKWAMAQMFVLPSTRGDTRVTEQEEIQ